MHIRKVWSDLAHPGLILLYVYTMLVFAGGLVLGLML